MVTGTNACLDITREDVPLSDADILSRYLGIRRIPCRIQSPLRDDDDSPSFSFFERGGRVFCKDFGTGESDSVVGLMARLWGVTYREALLKMRLDMGGTVPRFDLIRSYRGRMCVTHDSSISVKVREWKPWDVEYWGGYGISRAMCDFARVYPVSHAFFTRKDGDSGREETVCVPMEKYAYAYFEWKDGRESIKLYQPYSERMKWLSKHDASVWDLWKQAMRWAEERDDSAVVLTSSRKDAMCLWENLGVPAMSLQGEGYVPKPQVMGQVLDRFGTVYLWYDNDFGRGGRNPGQENAARLVRTYPSLVNVCNPTELGCKDPSDLVKARGADALREVFRTFKDK